MKTTLNNLFRLLYVFIFFGCVSVGLNDTKVERNKSVQYAAPPAPFREVSSDTLDHLWKNPNNGNSLSYLSECSDTSDPDLDSVQQGILRGVQKLQVVSSETLSFNDREALHTRARGKVDGVPTEMEIMIFKKNGCIYTLNYVGLTKSFDSQQKYFADFIKQFKAP